MLFCPHVYHVIQLLFYFKIIQGWSKVIWISMTIRMTCPLKMDVELHCVVKCGILEVEMHINDRWVQKQINKFK